MTDGRTSLPLVKYARIISLFTPFTMPEPPGGNAAGLALTKALTYLWHENSTFVISCQTANKGCYDTSHSKAMMLRSLGLAQKIQIFDQLLTVRNSETELPVTVCEDVETTIRHLATKKAPITNISQILPISDLVPASVQETFPHLRKISLWRGDITTLRATAIVNAANSRMLGCFTIDHKCIDNVIHAAAGPRVRDDCRKIMNMQGFLEPTGNVKVTRGYNLPAKYILHTVGPIIRGEEVGTLKQAQLASCYKSCLEVMEEMPNEVGGTTIAFCCISTGVYGYPQGEAAQVAVDTVMEYFESNPSSKVERVVFNVFTPTDLGLYIQKFNSLITTLTDSTVLSTEDFCTSPLSSLRPSSHTAISLAANWVKSAGIFLIVAGDCLPASDGLDCNSRDLLRTHFPGMWDRGFNSLNDAWGFNDWDGPSEQWGFYFAHLAFARSWVTKLGAESVYTKLKKLVDYHTRIEEGIDAGKNYFIRTSPFAEYQFLQNGFPSSNISTPIGSYELLQCVAKCRTDAVFNVQPYLDAAIPYLDLQACLIKKEIDGWESAIPKCPHCGGAVSPCVRDGDYFNESPFKDSNKRYREFLSSWMRADRQNKNYTERCELVILELGVGSHRPDIKLDEEGLVSVWDGRFKLIRVGTGGLEMVDWAMEGRHAVGIEGGSGAVVGVLLEQLEI